MATSPLRAVPDHHGREFERMLRMYANALGLRDWQFEIDEHPTPNEWVASITPIEGRKVAVVALCEAWTVLDGEAKRHALVHELVHVHMFPACDTMRDVREWMPERTYGLWWKAAVRSVEGGVDGLAAVIAPLLPPYGI